MHCQPTSFFRALALSTGYIIGLGDRHSSNILVHKGTAEVAHIDLGIAFEQGRFLNTPEQVPFRLTRDIVDGMGITGGLGSLCCSQHLLCVLLTLGSLAWAAEVESEGQWVSGYLRSRSLPHCALTMLARCNQLMLTGKDILGTWHAHRVLGYLRAGLPADSAVCQSGLMGSGHTGI